MKQQHSFSEEHLQPFRKVKEVCRAIDHPFRIKLLDYLLNGGEASVSKMIAYTRQEQTVVSQHLAILRKANLVKVKRNGKERLYSTNLDAITHYTKHGIDFISQN